MQVDRRSEPVTAAKDLREIRCAGTFREKPCGRILFRSTSAPIKAGGMIEIKCGKCEKVNYVIGRPET